ncbi:MAG: hypothetical protein K2W94_05355 [Alphaproteobacteria bacterium]|nr:hypothetical protein [Alphaproteobacteria bacterium]
MISKKTNRQDLHQKRVFKDLDFTHKSILLTTLTILVFICLTSDHSWALQADDAMRATSEALEKTLTGSWLRVGLLAGMIGGVVMSAVKQSPLIFAGSMGTGLGALYYKGWVADSFTALI